LRNLTGRLINVLFDRHSSGKGGYGNLAPVVSSDIDFSKLSVEEQEARAKLHPHDHGFMTGKGELVLSGRVCTRY
jgi:hypothetical protein